MRKSREELARMGSEELKEILRLDSQGVEEYSTEDILYMLDLIVQREKEAGENHVDVEAAWNRFQRQYLHREEETQAPVHTPQVRRWRLPRSLGATAAALALVFVGLLTAHAAGWDLLGGFSQWNDEIFTFGSLESESPVDVKPEDIDTVSPDQQQESEAITPEVLEYDTLQEALDACGITEVKAPTWLPEGCALMEITQTRDLFGDTFQVSASFQKQGKLIAIDIYKSGPSSTDVEKTEGSVDITDMFGHTVYIIENIHDFTVAWKTESYECYLSGPNRQDLEQMAASMLN